MMKKLLKSVLCVALSSLYFLAIAPCNESFGQGGVSVNKTNAPADPSAMLDVSSTQPPYLGMLIPRMSTANRNAIISPATGLQIFNTDCGTSEYYTGTCWISTGQNLKAPPNIACSGTTDFCSGTTRSFTVSTVTGATGYEWRVPAGATITAGQNTTSITVIFGNNSGEVCVTAENACETSQPRCIDVHISPVPTTPFPITGPTTVQPGATGSYFIVAVPGAGVYNWTVPSGATITSGVGTTAITVSFSCSAVSGNVTVGAQNSCGIGSAGSLAVSVNPAVTADAGSPISGHGTIGGSPTASAGTSPYTYAWTPSANLSNASVANPSSTACTTTTYTVTVTDANGCTASSSTTVSNPFLQLPSASASPNPVCAGSMLTLTTSTVSGATYSWAGPNGFTASTEGATISNIQTNQGGTYTVTALVSGCTETSSVTVTVSSPISTFAPLIGVENSPVSFTPTVSGATYSWTFDSGSPSTSTVQNPSVTWNAPGNYNVSLMVTDVNGCSSTTSATITIASAHATFIFTSVGTTQWTAPAGITSVQYLVVGGGGAGGDGNAPGGGGGAGGFVEGNLSVIPGNNYTVTVGAGGTTNGCNNSGNNGQNSVFDNIVAVGGGRGGGSAGNGASGGSGGGGGGPCCGNSPGSSTQTSPSGGTGYGNSGANYSGSGGCWGTGGGGGGAGGAGSIPAGGAGRVSNITGTNVTYARGGSGMTGCDNSCGGGGDGANGAANTGNGGGGNLDGNPGTGGSGIVVIKY